MVDGSSSRAVPYAQLGLLAAIVATLVVAAEPVSQAAERPRDAERVIARVPARDSEAQRRLTALKDAAALAPTDRARAVSLARGYIEAARSEGDPRFLGAAEAALARFTAEADVAPEVRVLHATILQARHAFPEALGQLERALAARPDDAQAWLTQASVQSVRGDYGAARESCARLRALASAVYMTGCTAPLDALTGHADAAFASLDAVLGVVSAPRERALLESLRGELSYWAGEPARAEASLRAALARDPADRYTRGLLADLLLDAGRPDEARALVQPYLNDDALALRGALAALALHTEDAGQKVARLQRGFADSRLRGDSVHQREEARLWLASGDDPHAERALARALESWRVQREPWDARLVLEAAVRAERPAAASEVLHWLATTGFQAPRLQTLAARLQTMNERSHP